MCGRVGRRVGQGRFRCEPRSVVRFISALGARFRLAEVVNLLITSVGGAFRGKWRSRCSFSRVFPYRLVYRASPSSGLAVIIWLNFFEWLESDLFGYGAWPARRRPLAAQARALGRTGTRLAAALVPHVSHNIVSSCTLFARSGLLGAATDARNEVLLLSSAASRDQWSPKDLGLTVANTRSSSTDLLVFFLPRAR